jgi:hypothetical protein
VISHKEEVFSEADVLIGIGRLPGLSSSRVFYLPLSRLFKDKLNSDDDEHQLDGFSRISLIEP